MTSAPPPIGPGFEEPQCGAGSTPAPSGGGALAESENTGPVRGDVPAGAARETVVLSERSPALLRSGGGPRRTGVSALERDELFNPQPWDDL